MNAFIYIINVKIGKRGLTQYSTVGNTSNSSKCKIWVLNGLFEPRLSVVPVHLLLKITIHLAFQKFAFMMKLKSILAPIKSEQRPPK